MTYSGHVKNGVIVLDEPAPIEEGMQVRVELSPADSPSTESNEVYPPLSERLAKFKGKVEFPADWSENHDKYIRESLE